MNLIGNEMVTTIGASIIGLFTGGIWVWLWIKSGISKAIQEGGAPVGNKLGLFVYYNMLKKIKDIKLRNKIATDLNVAGDDFDKGWDKGLKGIKL